MQKISSLAYILFAVIVIAGCSKGEDIPIPVGTDPGAIPGPNPGNPGTGSGKLDGTYEFVSVYLKGRTDASMSFMGETSRTISDVEYTSLDNTGTVVISGNKITSTNFSYKINALIKAVSYTNGVLDEDSEIEMPFSFSMPSSNSTGTFSYIGADSVYMENGFMQIPSTGQEIPSTPNASKYEIKNGELIFSSTINQSSSEVMQGVTIQKLQTGVAITRLKKK